MDGLDLWRGDSIQGKTRAGQDWFKSKGVCACVWLNGRIDGWIDGSMRAMMSKWVGWGDIVLYSQSQQNRKMMASSLALLAGEILEEVKLLISVSPSWYTARISSYCVHMFLQVARLRIAGSMASSHQHLQLLGIACLGRCCWFCMITMVEFCSIACSSCLPHSCHKPIRVVGWGFNLGQISNDKWWCRTVLQVEFWAKHDFLLWW